MTAVVEKTSGIDLRTLDIMVDYDDVVVPWAMPIHLMAHEIGLHDNTKLWSQWHMWEDYGCTKEEWLEAVGRATAEGLYIHTDPFPLAVEALGRLFWAGHRIHIVTARGTNWGAAEDRKRIRTWTKSHIERFGVPHHTLTFAHNKVEAMEALEVEFDFAVDDGVHNYELLDGAGVPVYLHDQPHNASFTTERRVRNLWEFADLVLQGATTR